jgi:hypothetical protein
MTLKEQLDAGETVKVGRLTCRKIGTEYVIINKRKPVMRTEDYAVFIDYWEDLVGFQESIKRKE